MGARARGRRGGAFEARGMGKCGGDDDNTSKYKPNHMIIIMIIMIMAIMIMIITK